MNIRLRCRLRFPGVNGDDLHIGVGLLVGLQSSKQDGVAPGGVSAGNQEHIGQFDVFVGAGHTVFAQCFGVARHGRTHA